MIHTRTADGNRKDRDTMYSFLNDYSEGAHERILEAMARVNREQAAPYGLDTHCERARALILAQVLRPESRVHFFTGGTQANLILLAAALRPHQGVIAADTGHINTHETGAIEATGHKVIALQGAAGKLDAADVAACLAAHKADANAEHCVQPAMVYISNPTELGTIYTKAELAALYAACRAHGAGLYLDGARLGQALVAAGNDLSLADIAANTSAFTIGGTKMGALLGEALVVNESALNADFRYMIKQRGAMLAKGRLLGIQFETLFEDGLYFELARHAVGLGQKLAQGIREKGYGFLVESPTNQVFPILPKDVIGRMAADFAFSLWQRVDEGHDALRLCCSWATPPEQVEAFLSALPSV